MMNFHDPNDNWLSQEMLKRLKPEDAQCVGCLAVLGYMAAILVAMCICAFFSSCSSTKNMSTNILTKDSVRIEVRKEVVYVPDTIYLEIPAQTSERTTIDSTSHLENEYAESYVCINADGTLYHNLSTKSQKKPIEVEKEIVNNDSIVYIGNISKETGQQILEVEKPLTWWQKTRIYGCYLFGLLLVISYRKERWYVIKRFIFRVLHPTG